MQNIRVDSNGVRYNAWAIAYDGDHFWLWTIGQTHMDAKRNFEQVTGEKWEDVKGDLKPVKLMVSIAN